MFKGGVTAAVKEDPSTQVENHGILKYPFTLNFYDNPPIFDVSIEEFETSALDRLRILAEVESSGARNRTWEEMKSVISTQCEKYLPLSHNFAKSPHRDAERRKDHLSHFVLRLAFCRSEELRRRFVKAETALFKIRYERDITAEREAFLNSREFNWITVEEDERRMLNLDLERKSDRYYKVKWTRVPDLVNQRKVVLKAGWAYVPSKDLSSVIIHEFEVQLERSLETTARLLPRLDEDTRIVPILDNLSQGFIAGISSEWSTASSANSDEIKADQVDGLAKQHFPLCMRAMHETFQKERHLKHFGRLHYGLFLKVLGLSVEEAIIFWRKDTGFNKEHQYNIRHSYGLEGRRANYPAKSCQQLLTATPTGNTIYGCPYKTHSPENLQTALLSAYSQQGLKHSDLNEIMASVKSTHFHVACTRVFELTHASCGVNRGQGVGDGESVTHPNQYAARSIALQKASEAMVVD